MEKLYFKIRKIEEENSSNYEISKMFGSPVFPTDFFEKNKLNDDFFLIQINLAEIKDLQDVLPKEGYLYFFLNILEYPYIPKVFYTNEEITTVYDDINEVFEEMGDYHGYELVFGDNSEDAHFILGDIDQDLDLDCEINTEGYVTLLQIDSLNLPNGICQLGEPDGWYIFLIKENDLKNLNFKNVKFISFGS